MFDSDPEKVGRPWDTQIILPDEALEGVDALGAGEIASDVSFDPVEVERERGVIIEEWRLGRGASARMDDQQFPVLFKGSRYAERLPIGTSEIIRTFAHERGCLQENLSAFISRHVCHHIFGAFGRGNGGIHIFLARGGQCGNDLAIVFIFYFHQ